MHSVHTRVVATSLSQLYLRNIEAELAAASLVFTSVDYCEQLTARLERSQSVLKSIIDRNRISGALTANLDESTLATERDALASLKQAALMTMLNEVKEDLDTAQQRAREINQAIRGGADAVTAAAAMEDKAKLNEPSDGSTAASSVAANSVAVNSSTAPDVTAASEAAAPSAATPLMLRIGDIMAERSLQLSAAASILPLPECQSICGILRDCYDMWNAVRTRQRWQAEFMVSRSHVHSNAPSTHAGVLRIDGSRDSRLGSCSLLL
jgi:paraquat-inducible protein B